MQNQIINPREVRQQLGMNQQEFWSKIGVTQSGGSRYESGRNMPRPVRELLRVVHVEQIDLERINREDYQIIQHLREERVELYNTLRAAAQAHSEEKPRQHSASNHLQA
ncbi:helix-turn-helix domain-containing protein [Iodobacter fluviatilis]|uniref:Putative zinc finger/helix-turn-helix protein, YgiT family n=1 Tax=Iodobacter fluviatilis TaxID=537 RepID=A0A377Q7C4_9NEIS|nr:helix-turn-helix transcriptional regulator [Iodobacter fluviatilis]TCU89453.1 transcriptional regulator with XRE-family HTH domain [Iodobacter fluviatilis]STQ90823.1 putative zinc finger/helix-turn-helix protein, YgiT family [Iodobacter fluviatilis]